MSSGIMSTKLSKILSKKKAGITLSIGKDRPQQTGSPRSDSTLFNTRPAVFRTSTSTIMNLFKFQDKNDMELACPNTLG